MKRQDIVKALVERGYRAEEQETTAAAKADDETYEVLYEDETVRFSLFANNDMSETEREELKGFLNK